MEDLDFDAPLPKPKSAPTASPIEDARDVDPDSLPRCPNCGYLLYKPSVPVCPECGRELSMAELRRPRDPWRVLARHDTVRRIMLPSGIVMLAAGVGLVLWLQDRVRGLGICSVVVLTIGTLIAIGYRLAVGESLSELMVGLGMIWLLAAALLALLT